MNAEAMLRENERMITALRTLAGELSQFAKPGGPKPTKDELWSLYSAAMHGLGGHVGQSGIGMTDNLVDDPNSASGKRIGFKQ